MKKMSEHSVEDIVGIILEDYEDDRIINKTDLYNQPDKNAILDIVRKLMKILYPGYYRDKTYKIYSIRNNLAAAMEDVIFHLSKQIKIVLRYCSVFPDKTDDELEEYSHQIALRFLEKIPKIREYLDTDIQAAYDGDPAAKSKEEVILSYPGLYAMSVYRIAHELLLLDVPMIPRIMIFLWTTERGLLSEKRRSSASM